MIGTKIEAPVRGKAHPGQTSRFLTTAGKSNLAGSKGKRHQNATYHIAVDSGGGFTVTVSGRDRWALDMLLEAGSEGCTPIDQPAPRWSAYVFNLREMGLAIETVRERHGRGFAGRHGRYVLRWKASRQAEGGAA